MTDADSTLAALRRGVYTVREICSILRPSMTARKVHYWLDKGMLGEAIQHGSPGRPTLLSFEQVLRIRTLQRVRDELGFTLDRARDALEWILENIVADDWRNLRFVFRTGRATVGVTDAVSSYEIHTRQGVLPGTIEELNAFLERVRAQWEQGFLEIEGFDKLVSNPAVLGGSPIILGTRIETAFIANLAPEETLAELHELFPLVDEEAIRQAADFEGVKIAA